MPRPDQVPVYRIFLFHLTILTGLAYTQVTQAETELISVSSNGVPGNGPSINVSLSDDGKIVAFDSGASNLVDDDNNGVRDIFVHDRNTKKMTRVSVSSDNVEADGPSSQPMLSADGRYVVFYSRATNLIDDDTLEFNSTIFLHDRETSKTTRVASSGIDPAISPDGRYIAFISFSTNLVEGDTNNAADVFVYDRTTGITKRVSVHSNGAQGNDSSSIGGGDNSHAYRPSFSSDGRYIVFESQAGNLIDEDNNEVGDIFIHDQHTGETERISISYDGKEANGGSDNPRISSDGNIIAFRSIASNLIEGDNNNIEDIFIHNRETGETRRVNVSSQDDEAFLHDPGIVYSTIASVSSNGRFVVFHSNAINLVQYHSLYNNIYVRDLKNKITNRISLGYNGSDLTGSSSGPVVSSDGRVIAYSSSANELVDSDTNSMQNIFVFERDSADLIDEDNDGIIDVLDTDSNANQINVVIGSDSDGDGISDDLDNCPKVYNPGQIDKDNNGKGDVCDGFLSLVNTSNNSFPARTESISPALSNSGSIVAFQSRPLNLIADEPDHIYVFDGDSVSLVSISTDGNKGDGHSRNPSISGDGRFITFTSNASNLIDGKTAGATNVYIHDRETGKTTDIISGLSHPVMNPEISDDGNHIVFNTPASLVIDDTNDRNDTYVFDRKAGELIRVSISYDGQNEDGQSLSLNGRHADISSDGVSIAFINTSSNLLENDTNGVADVFVYDRTKAEMTRVNVSTDGEEANLGTIFSPRISADGNVVAFSSEATNLVPDDENGFRDIFLHDRSSGETTRISTANDGSEGNGHTWDFDISGDGRYVIFKSSAGNLIPGMTISAPAVYLHDRDNNNTLVLNVNYGGAEVVGNHNNPSISFNGKVLAFDSDAKSFVQNDVNQRVADIFIANENPGDLNFNGIPDPVDVDSDNDGISEANDNCPLVANPGQKDTDSDGVGDACNPDADGDGILNENYNCPLAANHDQEDTDSDGVGDVCDSDSDGDGMPNIYELRFGLDPLDPSDAALDIDEDGYTNLEEYSMGRNPLVNEEQVLPVLNMIMTIIMEEE